MYIYICIEREISISCENLCLGIAKPGFSHPGQTFLGSRESLCFQSPC